MAQEVWFKVSDAPVTMGVLASNGYTLSRFEWCLPNLLVSNWSDTRRTSDTQMARMEC